MSAIVCIVAKKFVEAPQASLDDVAEGLVQLHLWSPVQARNAYSAVLLLPGFLHLRFHPLLRPYKKLWNTNVEKYGTFWDAEPVLRKLAGEPLEPPDANEKNFKAFILRLRARLIVVSRLLCLFRSIDLANMTRTVSVVQGKPFILLKRKGCKPTSGKGWCPYPCALPSAPGTSFACMCP